MNFNAESRGYKVMWSNLLCEGFLSVLWSLTECIIYAAVQCKDKVSQASNYTLYVCVCVSVLISLTKTTMKNILQQTFFLLLWEVEKLKLISDDKNYDEICAASCLTRRDGTKMLFED